MGASAESHHRDIAPPPHFETPIAADARATRFIDGRASISKEGIVCDMSDDARDAPGETTANEEAESDVDFLALVRRAKAIADVAAADAASAERLARAEERWGQAITRDGKRYYFDKTAREHVQWECPRELKASRVATLRAEAVDRVELPPGWRELKSATAEKIPYYWNIETGDVRWERPRNDALIVARVVPASAPSS